MPRTRNVSRDQWDTANEQSTRSKRNTRNTGEKENAGRVPRTTRARTTGLADLNATTRSAVPSKSKGKGKPPPKGRTTKVAKMPLQDITARYLPAPESANRGYTRPTGFGAPADPVISPTVAGPSNIPLVPGLRRGRVSAPRRGQAGAPFTSSLPPSSPPSHSSHHPPSQPQLPVLSRDSSPFDDIKLARKLFDTADADGSSGHVYDAWQEFDQRIEENSGKSSAGATPRNSDPFGFFALEQKLKGERRPEEDEGGSEGVVLVEDSSPKSSPLGKSLLLADPEPSLGMVCGLAFDTSYLPPTPPTPHKRRVSRQGCDLKDSEHIFSPHPSSCPSSPSPTKPTIRSSAKRKVALDFETFHDETHEGTPTKKRRTEGRVRTGIKQVEESSPSLRRSTRSKGKKVEASSDVKPGPSRRSRTTKTTTTTIKTTTKPKRQAQSAAVKKGRNTTKRAVSQPADESDEAEKRQEERQKRIEYFRQLDDYEVECEEVYVV